MEGHIDGVALPGHGSVGVQGGEGSDGGVDDEVAFVLDRNHHLLIGAAVNTARAERVAARAELSAAPKEQTRLSEAEIDRLLDDVGDVATALNEIESAELSDFYEAFHLELRYDPELQIVDVAVHPLTRVVSEGVRGGTRYLSPRLLTARLDLIPA